MKKILAEFKAQMGDILLDLDNIGESERREFLDRFLDTEQNNLGSVFRQKLFERTRGHPLYTIEMLRCMQDQGQLCKDPDGFWIERENLKWEFMPIRVEGVIEERISHLDANLQEILSVASVEGLQFSTQVIAGVLGISEEHLSRRLGQELANRYRLVVEKEGFRLNGSFLTQFRFAHPLIQQYLYDRLGQQERIALHRRIAQMLEEFYEGQLEVVAYQLVLHYAGEREKVMKYARIAGEYAAAQFAHQEALHYFGTALEFTPMENHQDRIEVILAREKIFDNLGNRHAQWEDLSELEKLADLLCAQEEGNAFYLAEVKLRQARYATWCSDYPAAIAASQSALDLGEKLQDIITQTSASLELGHALLRIDRYQESQFHLENGLKLARLAQNRHLEGLALYYLLNLNYVDETSPESSDLYFHQAITIFNELGFSYEMALTLNTYALSRLSKYDFNGAKECIDELLYISRQHGYRLGEAYGLTNLPLYYMSYGDYSTAKLYLEQGLLINEEINNRYLYWCALIFLCVCHRYLGDFQASEIYGKQALDIADEIGSLSCKLHSLNIHGHTQFVLGNWDDAREAYLDSLKLIADVGFTGYKQEAKAGLIQLLFAQGDLDKALEEIEFLYPDLENSNIIVYEGDWIYTLGYKVLKACGDSRADILLQKVYDLFLKISEKFEDEELGRSYLENVHAHREILQEWRLRQKT
ncbi:MAG: hypothetical protein JSV61_06980 [Anaerolineales bacterium]|nr:MAG: hypothetical protein JSV61_06980 [Anaerolineales bacterium]